MISVGRQVITPSGRRGVVRAIKAEVVYDQGDTVFLNPELLTPADPTPEECQEIIRRHEEQQT